MESVVSVVSSNPKTIELDEKKEYIQLVCVFCQKAVMENDWVEDDFTWKKPAHKSCYEEKKSQLAHFDDKTESGEGA